MAGVANAVMGRDRFPGATQRHGGRYVQVTSEEIIATRSIDVSSARMSRGIQSSLEGRGFIRPAITFGSEILYRECVRIGRRKTGKRPKGESEKQRPARNL